MRALVFLNEFRINFSSIYNARNVKPIQIRTYKAVTAVATVANSPTPKTAQTATKKGEF